MQSPIPFNSYLVHVNRYPLAVVVNQYVKDKSLPDTAVDLIDAAGAAVQLQRSLLLEEVVEIHKREERDNLKLLRENKPQKPSRL